MLYDLKTDPLQEKPLKDERMTKELLVQMKRLMEEDDAPQEIFDYYGL